MGQYIKTEQLGQILIAKFYNPPHALLCKPMVEEFDALVDQAEIDPNIKVVILSSLHEDRFLAHYDVEELLTIAKKSPSLNAVQAKGTLGFIRQLSALSPLKQALSKTPAAGVIDLQDFHNTMLKMGRSGVIYIAAINGSTAGGGLELSLACDLRYISDQAELAQPEVLLGFPPGGGGTQRLARLIGRAKALELMLTGRVISPSEAFSLGLVTEVVPHDQLLDVVTKQAAVLAKRFKPAVQVIKQAVLEGGSLPLEQGLRVEQAAFLEMLGTDGAQRAMQAYVDFMHQHGKLAAIDEVAKQQLQDGTFVKFD
jgi:enoyl-CoA hydratase